jgi:hypothetical protein
LVGFREIGYSSINYMVEIYKPIAIGKNSQNRKTVILSSGMSSYAGGYRGSF